MRDLIPVGLFVQFLISILTLLSGRRHHTSDGEGVDVFRIYPGVAWLLIVVCYSFAAFLGFLILTSHPTPLDAPVAFMVGEITTFGFGVLGIYCLTLRIRVDADALSVSSVFGKRATRLSDLVSVADKQTGRYRSLRVTDSRGNQVLNVTSSFLGDYDELVGLLQSAAQERSVQTRTRG
jgi:hypothetical protein